VSVWREVQEALYQRWRAQWVDGLEPLTPYCFDDEKMTPPDGPWVRFSVKRMPGGPGTLGRPGNRKMDRVGMVFIQLFQPPGLGIGPLSDLGERAAGIFENCRIISPHDIRFGEVEPGASGDVEGGRYTGLSVEGRFDYQQTV
jgi:hypothetical protein